MKPVLSQVEMAAADRYAIEQLKIPASTLMEHAAMAIAERVSQRFSPLKEFPGLVVAGPGNNGGDVLAAARLLLDKGAVIDVVIVEGQSTLSKECQAQKEMLVRAGVVFQAEVPTDKVYAWALDGLFGIGINRPTEGDFKKAIAAMNACHTFVVAADIPSGLNADTGQPLGECIRASETVTLGFYKRGLVTGKAADFTGALSLAEIGIPRTIPGITPAVGLVEQKDVAAGFPKRNPSAHKGSFGHVIIVAGPMPQLGAAVIAACGALHAGAGLVSVAGEPAVLSDLRKLLPPEIMLEETIPALEKSRAAVVVLGPGMGQGDPAKALLKTALASPHPLVLDADALNLLAESGLLPLARKQAPVLMTPHPKEASRLLQTTVEDVEKSRYDAINRLVQRTGAVCLLKGRGTLVKSPGAPCTYVINEGTAALAKGGSGDLLAGCVAAFLSQGLSPEKALAFGAFAHGRAAQFWEDRGEDARSITPTQVAKALSQVLKDLT